MNPKSSQHTRGMSNSNTMNIFLRILWTKVNISKCLYIQLLYVYTKIIKMSTCKPNVYTYASIIFTERKQTYKYSYSINGTLYEHLRFKSSQIIASRTSEFNHNLT